MNQRAAVERQAKKNLFLEKIVFCSTFFLSFTVLRFFERLYLSSTA